MLRRFVPFFIVLLTAHFAGCASAPEKVDRIAADLGFTRIVLEGNDFQHVAYFSPGRSDSDTLHVYFEGDGSPFIKGYVSHYPTPDEPHMLKLMRYDPTPSLLLGRPCYFGTHTQPECSLELWTLSRYGTRVIDSTEQALRNFMRNPAYWSHVSNAPYKRVGLFGHSGGGALAMLLAPRFAETYAAATIAGNLDTDAWTTLHRYTPLVGSFNPAEQPLLPEHIAQVHLAGAKDTVIPPEIIHPVVARQHGAIWRIEAGASHTGPWDAAWQQTLSYLNTLPR